MPVECWKKPNDLKGFSGAGKEDAGREDVGSEWSIGANKMKADSRFIPLKNNSVNCIVTSPPYWGLRKYDIPDLVWDGEGGCEHEWGNRLADHHPGQVEQTKWKNAQAAGHGQTSGSGQFCLRCSAWRGQLGLEPTIKLYISHLLQITKEIWRALKKDGTFWLNIGDSYAGSGQGWMKDGQAIGGSKQKTNQGSVHPWPTGKPPGYISSKQENAPKPKDLCLIPFRLVLALQAQGWWIRSDIIYSKPNPMPESVRDRPTRSHEYLFLLTKSGKATCWRHDKTKEWVWEKPEPDYIWVKDDKGKERRVNLWKGYDYFWDQDAVKEPWVEYERARRLREKEQRLATVFNIARDGKTGQHPQGKNGVIRSAKRRGELAEGNGRNVRSVWIITTQPYSEAHYATFPEELVERCIKAGCPKCGIVLDPFCGSGTVQRIAERLNRVGIGFDLGYLDLQQKRASNIQKEIFV